jgi:hypothetical protein
MKTLILSVLALVVLSTSAANAAPVTIATRSARCITITVSATGSEDLAEYGRKIPVLCPPPLFFLTFCHFQHPAAWPGQFFLAGSGAFAYIAARLRLPDIS